MRKKKKEEKCKMIIKLEMDKEMYKAMKRYEKAREENNEEESVQDAPEIIQFHQDKTNDEPSNIVISIDIKHDSVCEGNGQPPTFGAKKPQ